MTKLVIDGVEAEASSIDWALGVGIQVNALLSLLLARPDVEARLWNGRIELAYRGGGRSIFIVGWNGVPWTVNDWSVVVGSVAKMTKPETVG